LPTADGFTFAVGIFSSWVGCVWDRFIGVCCLAILWSGLVSITISLRADVYHRLYDYCRSRGVKPSHFISALVEEYLRRVEGDAGKKA
jgi:hypothetical protein